MSATQFSVRMKSLVFMLLLFVFPLGLTAQSSQLNFTPPALTKKVSIQPGNLLMRPSLTDNLRILFILVQYPGGSGAPINFSQAQEHRNVLLNSLNINSYNATTITIDITPVLNMPNSESFYKNSSLIRMREDAATAAEQAGFDLTDYDREIIFSNKVWGGATALGTINRSTSLMSQNTPYVSAHEFGHSLGWRHANFWKVSSGSPISSNGTDVPYGDKYDMMGGSAGKAPFTSNDYHHFNPWLKQRVGWLLQENILSVINSGIYTIQAIETTPMSSPVTKYTALRIRKDPLTDYYIFFRSKESFISNGPVITRIFNNNIMSTHLLDMTPGSQSEDWKDAALRDGKTFDDTAAGISVKVLSVSSSEVQVDVTVDANAIASMDNLPVIDVTSPLEGVTVKGGIDYVVTAFDPDFGTTDGAGIDKVKLYIHRLTDLVIQNLNQGLDPPTPDAITELSAQPYRWYVDSNSLPQDAIYFFIAKAISLDGGTQTLWFPYIVDNSGVPSAPAAPALSLPADNATGISTNVSLDWNNSSGATSYQLQVSTVADFSTTFIDQSGITSDIYQTNGLLNNTTYYWRVNATNANGTSPYSTVWQFTTIIAAPAAPALSSPSDNATDISTTPNLVWNASGGATSYDVQVSTQSNFATLEVDQSGLSATSFQTTALSNSTIHYWRVRAINANGTSDWSSVRLFTTIVAAPAAPLLSFPADNATNLPIELNLRWNTVSGAVSYQVQVSTQSDFSTGLISQSDITLTSFAVSDLANETTHFWRVNATNAGGTSPWSPVWQFITEPVSSVETGSEIPSDFRLGQNYPNPFNPTTNIAFDLPKSEYVSLKVYTLLGNEVATLVSGNLSAGKYTIKFDASSLSSGVFFYKLQTISFVETRKMLLMR